MKYTDSELKEMLRKELRMTREAVSKDQVKKLLIKRGNNEKEVDALIAKEFDVAVKAYPSATASKIADVIVM